MNVVQHLMRCLIAALDQLPDHQVTVTPERWAALADKYTAGATVEGGILLEMDGGTISARLADHEDKAVAIDRVRAEGGTVVVGDGYALGMVPDEP